MKIASIVLLLILPLALLGQNKKIEFGLSLGNNGQLDKTLNDYYFPGHETAYLDDSYEDKTTNLKYSGSLRYFINKEISIRLKFGYAIRKDYYTKSDPNRYVDYDFKQTVFNVGPSICFSKSFDKLEIMTGFEIPIFSVGNFNFSSNYKVIPDSITVTQEVNSTITMGGGLIWGVNNFICLRYFFTDRVGIGAEFDYGLLFADLGDTYQRGIEYVIPSQPTTNSEFDKQYKKTFFSPPEVSFGLYIQL